MPVAAYRVCRRIYSRLDGEGARRVGGRWNSPGQPVVYMAQSAALAALENLVHMSRQDYPTGYVIVEATILDHVLIPEHTRFLDPGSPSEMRQRTTGDDWLASGESAVLRVPSAVVTWEWNYLINPEHLDSAQITIEPPVAMRFDERLFARE
jgi:RES domain-containing protein